MNIASQRLCVFSAVLMIVFFGIGLLTAGFIPPPGPGLTAEQIAAIYLENQGRIRAGILIVLVGTVFYAPWQVVISIQLRRIEHGWGPLSSLQALIGGLGLIPFVIPATLFLTAAYRPEARSAESTQLLHDIACLTLVGMANMVVLQNLVIGLAILRDRNERRVFPRWAGFVNLWTVVLLAPGFCVYLFRSGPLAWNGVFAWWVPVLAFGAWYAVMVTLVYRAIADEERETASAHPPFVPSSPAQ